MQVILHPKYRPSSQNQMMYSTYKRVAPAGEFNAQVGEKLFDFFLYQHEVTSINKNPTCYKNPNNPSCIHHVLTDSPKSFFKTLFSKGSQIFIKFYLYFSYIFPKRGLRRYRTGVLKISKRITLIKIFRKDF